ncbi:MAG: cell wall-binding repeat-containing protein [Coriobacteriia bacterium]|nr:cell wall-binding repeat-containing protein [Coriobacteriia bacterium]
MVVVRRGFGLISCVLVIALVVSQAGIASGAAAAIAVRPDGGEDKAITEVLGKQPAQAVLPASLAPCAIPGAVDLPSSPAVGALDAATHAVDVYRIALPADTRLACTLTGDSALDADVYVFSGDATVVDPAVALAGSVGDEFPKTVVFDVPDALGAGDYYVAVRAAAGAGSYQLAWSTCAMPGSADDDVPGSALSASEGSVVDSLAWPCDTFDVFAIDVAAGQRLEASVTGPSGADFDLLVYAPGTSSVYGTLPVAGSAGPGSSEAQMHDVFAGEGGTYYLAVRSVRGSGAYTLTWKVSSVPAGTWEDFDAASALIGATGSQLGTLDRETDANDVFKVVLLAGQRLTVTLNGGASTDFDLYLHAPDKSHVVAYSNDSAYPDRIVHDATADGEYFLEVRAFSGAGGYQIEWSIGTTPVFVGAARDAGADRYLTAIEVSRKTFPDGSARAVVLASGEAFPDALCASGLAGCLRSPVLLTRASSLPSAVLLEIGRLGATKVYIVGGPGAVSDGVKKSLQDAGLTVERVYGSDRYATARAVADKVRVLAGASFAKTAFLVRGDDYADALSASAAAYALRVPIVLTRTSALSPAAQTAITGNGIETVYIVGGTGVVSDDVKTEVSGLVGGPVIRLSGTDRYATAVEVSRYALRYYWLESDTVFLARGDAFPDALGGGAAAGAKAAALLLTRPTVLSDPTRDHLAGHKGEITAVRIIGGVGAVSDDVKTAVENVLK